MLRSFTLLTLLVLSLSSCNWTVIPQDAHVPLAKVNFDKESFERDLELIASTDSPNKVESGISPVFKLAIKNRSDSKTYRIIKPGDGSGSGWRPPHVYSTVKFFNSSTNEWVDADKAPLIGRCGNFDPVWQDESVELKPGGTLELEYWFHDKVVGHDIHRPGKYRIYWHYDFDPSKENHASRILEQAELDKVSRIPKFKLTSKPFDLQVTSSLQLHLEVIAQGKDLQGRPSITNGYRVFDLESIFKVSIENTSDKTRQVVTPTLHGEARVFLQGVKVDDKKNIRQKLPRGLMASSQRSKARTTFELKPNAKVELFGTSESANVIGGEWETSDFGKYQFRAVYMSSTWNRPSPVYYSDWVPFELPK